MPGRLHRATLCGIGAVLLLPGLASAAKGVKKIEDGGDPTRTYSGRIASVTYNKDGTGTITLQPSNSKRAAGAVPVTSSAEKVTSQTQFSADKTTKLTNENGGPAAPSLLKQGVGVRVRATGSQANSIQVFRNRPQGNFNRSNRVASYRPSNYSRGATPAHQGHRGGVSSYHHIRRR